MASRAACGLFAALVFITPALAQRRERVVDTWKPLHYDVAITFNDQLTEIAKARTEISVEVLTASLTRIDLDFGEMPVDSVSVSGEPARFERGPELLNITLASASKAGDKLSIIVTYHGRPKDGLIFASDRDGKPSATGDNWPNRVHQWIPCLDHPSAKATVSFTVAAPPREVVVANGKLLTMTRNSAAPNVWRFKETKSIPPYCMVIAVSEGAKLDANEKTVTPLSYYIPQRDRAYAAKGFSPAAPALAFFSETIAPYPYEKLALIIGATRFGGMENSSAIVFTSTLFDPRGNEKMSKRFGIPSRIEDVVAHEIAHQWFGDSVTESTWADLWLSEGFATYFAGLFIEKFDGEDVFRDYMRNAAERYFAYEKQRNTPIHDTETQDLMRLLNENNYQKGAWVLHMLRKRLGDEVFFRALRAYYNAHAQANATTEDLRDALEKASGQNLHEFFARWVYGTGHPVYKLTYGSAEFSAAGEFLTITLDQTQPGESFLDPVPIEITTADSGKKRYTISPTNKTATLRVHLDTHATAKVIKLDPDETLLKEVVAKQ
ncbi:MAG TPA: M1 family metallopeptidase [Pyrinomonadaceae bacterium]|nr:M1 family metallopeptidase [Pyrinomonadaceae bacterium]